jgi:type I restriction enzyme R subunit
VTAAPWSEIGLSEDPAVALLERFGYAYVSAADLDAERPSPTDVVLVGRLEAALRRLNPWISDANLARAVRDVTHASASSLIETNEKLYALLTHGGTVTQDLGAGSKGQTVRYFDFTSPRANDLLVTRQLRVKGSKKQIIPDVVVYVNGVPLVVIECKSPTLGETWQHEASTSSRATRRSTKNTASSARPGSSTPCRSPSRPACKTPSTARRPRPSASTRGGRTRGRTSSTPSSASSAARRRRRTCCSTACSRPRRCSTSSATSCLRGRQRDRPHPQEAAALPAVRGREQGHRPRPRASEPFRRGGVVWHTQGSGKSITMLWLALKLRRDEANANPTIVIVTDRRDLDDQISATLKTAATRAPTARRACAHLRVLLTGPTGKTVLTTVQKFQEVGGIVGPDGIPQKPKHPVLSRAENLFVLTDEAHRTQYGSLAANLRVALPNASSSASPARRSTRRTRARSRPSAGTSTSTRSSRR